MTKNEQSRVVRRPNLRTLPLNKTTLFMLPSVNFNKDKISFKLLKYFGFINCYLDYKQSLETSPDFVYLVFNPDKEAIRRFRDFYDLYKNLPNFINDYVIDNNLIVVVFKVRDKWKDTLNAFRHSRYSSMSKEYAELFKRPDLATGRVYTGREYHIIHRSKELREHMEKELNARISPEAELMSPLDMTLEMFDYDHNKIRESGIIEVQSRESECKTV